MIHRSQIGALLLSLVSVCCAAAPANPLETVQGPHGPQLDKQLKQRWQVGVVITASSTCGNIYATAPIPTSWPEQQVEIVKEDLSPHVKAIRYRTLENGVKQMLVAIPRLQAGETATALVTVEVTRSALLPPADTQNLKIPAKLPRDFGRYINPSPMIESRNPQLISVAKDLLKDHEDANAWTKVEIIYDFVRKHVAYQNGDLKGALAAYRDQTGDCEELTSLFIALCRANKIPARTVWVPDHCYPEFYLVDEEGKGYWFPCQAAGTRDFGGIPEFRPVLQKGDNFKVPEHKEPQRYVAEFMKMLCANGQKPQYEFVRKLLPAE